MKQLQGSHTTTPAAKYFRKLLSHKDLSKNDHNLLYPSFLLEVATLITCPRLQKILDTPLLLTICT
jgi:hypothetical protein